MDQFNLLVQQVKDLTVVVQIIQKNNTLPPVAFLPGHPQVPPQRQTHQSRLKELEHSAQWSLNPHSEYDSTPSQAYSHYSRAYTTRDAEIDRKLRDMNQMIEALQNRALIRDDGYNTDFQY